MEIFLNVFHIVIDLLPLECYLQFFVVKIIYSSNINIKNYQI